MKFSPLFEFKSIMLSTAFAATVAIPALAVPLASTTLVPLLVPVNCAPPASAGCGLTSQPITAFGAVGPIIASTLAPPTFSGTWGAGVAPAWVGTFAATGPYPGSPTDASTSNWDFSGIGPQGFLPKGTFVALGDLDGFGGGGVTEQLDLVASDANGLITVPWLDDVYFISSLACSLDCVQASMPQYVWNATSGTYSFDGANVTTPNPTLTVWLVTNKDILGLSVNKSTLNNGFGLAAPANIPEPGSLLLVGLSLAVLTLAKISRRQRN